MGAPICRDCYDTASAVVWQWWAPELWRRFTIALRRNLARRSGSASRGLGEVASVQYAKVAEFQTRGLVHFHALIRLDGPAADGIGSPGTARRRRFADAVRAAVPAVELSRPAVDDEDVPPRLLVWGSRSTCGPCGPGSAPTTRPGR